jgi:UDP-N-acetylglucosamine 1-carboxyvinyltransferase
MGADIWVEKLVPVEDAARPGTLAAPIRYGTRAEITGPTPLHGAAVRCLDIRAGAGVVLAGLVASGETIVSDVHHLDRGYEDLVPKLRDLGARIDERPGRSPEVVDATQTTDDALASTAAASPS